MAAPHTRSAFFKRSGVLAAGGVAVGAVPVGFAVAQGGLPKRDVDILNYALTLEFLEAAFYRDALDKGQLRGEVREFAEVVGEHEQAHVDALKQVLGNKAVKSPRFNFKNATSRKSFLGTAKVLEDAGVSAYQGQAHRIQTDAVLESAGAILAVEARHAAWVADIIGDNPAPDAFSPAMTMEQILAAVEDTGFIRG